MSIRKKGLENTDTVETLEKGLCKAMKKFQRYAKKAALLLLSGLLIISILSGCSNETKGNSSRAALEREAISIYEEVNGYGTAERDGFTKSLKDYSDNELRMMLGY